MLRSIAVVATVLVVASPVTPARSAVDDIVIEGTGAAHGMGLAMDGVLGQAKAGWTHPRILDLFYPDTVRGTHAGTVRVGLARSPDTGAPASAPARLAFELPSGGRVTGAGVDLDVDAGRRIVVAYADGRYTVETGGGVRTAQDGGIIPLPSETPAPSATPVSTPAPDDPDTPVHRHEDPTGAGPVTIVPAGDLALTLVEATGRRYRGTMVVRWSGHSQALWAVNHVDLETYVQGIAEEKGQGWPHEGLKVLAVAARSLAASTMTWRTNRHPDHNDICATEMCQVYLGYDGEEPAMIEATRATRGEIRTYGGRAILAMYHGNGGGQTDTYRLIYGNGTSDPYPYLRSVRYPHANPRPWTFTFSSDELTSRLREHGHDVTGPVAAIEVLERGDSPRVRRLRVRAADGEAEMSGLAFQSALDLPSAWFDAGIDDVPDSDPPPVVPNAGLAIAAGSRPPAAPASGTPAPLRTTAFATLLAAVSLVAVRRFA